MNPATTQQNLESDVIDILNNLTADWDTGLSGPINADTSIVANLAFESLDVVYLVTAIGERYDRRDLPFEELLMVDGRYVDDLTVRQIAQFLSAHVA